MKHAPLDRFHMALATRQALFDELENSTNAFRLIHGSGDGFPGITVDLLGAVLLVEAHDPDAPTDEVIDCARNHFGSETPIFVKERWSREDGRRNGFQLSGRPSPPEITVCERGLRFAVHLVSSEHIGVFLDSRPARALIRSRAKGARVLNLFSYTGGFGMAAAAGDARSTTNIDNKRSALAIAQKNYEQNNLRYDTRTFLLSDVFKYLSRAARGPANYDIVVLDPPPKFKRQGSRLFHVKTGYTALLSKSLRVLSPGGTLLAGLNYTAIGDSGFLELVQRGLHSASKKYESIEIVGPGRDFPYCPDRPTARFAVVSKVS